MNDLNTETENLHDQVKSLEEKLNLKINQMRSIRQIGKTLSSELNRDRLLLLIMDEVTELMQAERGTLYIVDNEKGELWSKIAQKAEIKEIHLKIGTGIAGYVAKTGETIKIDDAYNDDRFDSSVDKKTGYKTNTILCLPIREPVKSEKEAGQIIGVLQILNKIGGVFTEDDVELLNSLASQISISLVNSRLYSILEDRVNELDLFYQIEQQFSHAENYQELIKNLMKMVAETIQSESALLLLFDNNQREFSEKFAINIREEKLIDIQFDPDEFPLNHVIKKKSVLANNEIESSQIPFAKQLDLKVQQLICGPLITDKINIGVLLLFNKIGHHRYFSNSDQKLISSIAGQLARGIHNMRLKEEKMKADRLATIGNTMSAIVHDLRTPMNNIYGFVDLMREEEQEDVRTEYAEIINQQIKMLTNMTTDVLDFAKGKSGVLLRKYPVDKLVKEFVKFFEADVIKRGFKFEWRVDTIAMIYADPEKLTRVFMNIMKNALEAMDAGGKFSLTAEQQNKNILFKLSDTGKGIPEEIRSKLFESFVTSGKKGGTGLGLAIVKKVVEEHKGTIEVESAPGKGTTFLISVPKLTKQ